MRMKLVIAADVDRTFVDRVLADSRFEVQVRPCSDEADLVAAAADAVVLVTRAHNRISRAVLDAAGALRLIAQGTSGIDNIDIDTAAERGIRVVHLPGGNANAVAELVLGHMLALTRTVPSYARELTRGEWGRTDCATRHELRHYRLGIIGLGHVGRRVAALAAAFGVQVTAFDPYLTERDVTERGARRSASLDALLRNSDILSLHVPLTGETRGLIDAARIRMLPRGAILINTARGEVLDLTAALGALEDGHLSGLAVDVFDPEPPGGGLPDDPRLIATPHIAGCSFEAKAEIGVRLYERLVETLFG